jgi:hypothetical protein
MGVFATSVIALMFAVLLGLEWRFSWRTVRVGIIILALIVYWVFPTGPNYTIAGRRAMAVPVDERIKVLRGDTLSEYFTGVDIMREYLRESEGSSGPRLIVLGALVWLACVPVFRREPVPRQSSAPRSDAT